MSNNLQRISEILGLVEVDTTDSFILSLKYLSTIASALDIDTQFIKAIDTLGNKGLDSGYIKGFPSVDVDLLELVSNFSKEKDNKKRAVLVLNLRTNYKSFIIDEKGKKKLISNPDKQAKQYSFNGQDKFTNFYSESYLKNIADETGNNIEFFETNSLINLAVIYHVPIPNVKPVKEVKKEVKKKKKASNK